MVRKQVQLTERQAERLGQIAVARQESVAELIRRSVDLFVEQEAASGRPALKERAKAVAGRFASGGSDGSRDHDRHLADVFSSR